MSAADSASGTVAPVLFRCLQVGGLSFPVTVAVVSYSGAAAILRYEAGKGISVVETVLATAGEVDQPAFALFVDDHSRHVLGFIVNDDAAILSKPMAGRGK